MAHGGRGIARITREVQDSCGIAHEQSRATGTYVPVTGFIRTSAWLSQELVLDLHRTRQQLMATAIHWEATPRPCRPQPKPSCEA